MALEFDRGSGLFLVYRRRTSRGMKLKLLEQQDVHCRYGLRRLHTGDVRYIPRPLIFEPYSADLAERISAQAPRAVLETAAGSPGGRLFLQRLGQHPAIWLCPRHNGGCGKTVPGEPSLAHTPHGYHDVATIEADLRAAGFSAIRIETVIAKERCAESSSPHDRLLPGYSTAK